MKLELQRELSLINEETPFHVINTHKPHQGPTSQEIVSIWKWEH